MARTSGREGRGCLSRACSRIDCEVFFVFNGTAANSLALAVAVPVLSQRDLFRLGACRDRRMRRAGVFFQRLETADRATADGKLTPDAIRGLATNRTDIHFPKPRVVTITQPTETGQVYSVSTKCARCRRAAANSACACTWTARALPMLAQVLGVRRRT